MGRVENTMRVTSAMLPISAAVVPTATMSPAAKAHTATSAMTMTAWRANRPPAKTARATSSEAEHMRRARKR